MKEFLFDVLTPLKFKVHCTEDYWAFISTVKHPAVRDKQDEIKLTLMNPDEIRQSLKDPNFFLFYRGSSPRWICGVAKNDVTGGFLITAYLTDKIKVGESIWKK